MEQVRNPESLCLEDIIEVLGPDVQPSDATDVEILFTTRNEIGKKCFQQLKSLKRFVMIDNTLSKISNLAPVSNTLKILCLCDQLIIKMENLDLPVLQELYLHRNEITCLEGLSGLPRLRKLWLFQNKITEINDLHCCPELEELWIQSNLIKSLNGLDNCDELYSLSIAGNPIDDFGEIMKLTKLTKLRSLTLSDLHFGRCPLVDDVGYKEFILYNLKNVIELDGIQISKDEINHAKLVIDKQKRDFQNELNEINEIYLKEIEEINSDQKSREDHSGVLEKEMIAALGELQKYVQDGRKNIAKEVDEQKKLMARNYSSLENDLNINLDKARSKVISKKKNACYEYDLQVSLFCLLERILGADAIMHDILCNISTPIGNSISNVQDVEASYNDDFEVEDDYDNTEIKNNKSTSKRFSSERTKLSSNIENSLGASSRKHQKDDIYVASQPSVIFTNPGYNTPDFQMLSAKINIEKSDSKPKSKNSASRSRNKKPDGSDNDKISSEAEGSFSLELVRMYLIHSPPSWMSFDGGNESDRDRRKISKESDNLRVFTIMTSAKLNEVLQNGWDSVSETIIFCTRPEAAVALYSTAGNSFEYEFDFEVPVGYSANTSYDTNGNIPGDYDETPDNILYGSPSVKNNQNKMEIDMPNYKQAVDTKVLLLLSCRLDTVAASITTTKDANGQFHILQIPSSFAARSEMYNDLKRARKAVGVEVGLSLLGNNVPNPFNIPSMLYTLPPNSCKSTVHLDCICICVTPEIEHGARSIESKIELLMMPKNTIDNTSVILSTFEQETASSVKLYIDKVLEQVDSEQANFLININEGVLGQEKKISYQKDEIEKERKKQDNLLRELKGMSVSDEKQKISEKKRSNK